ncbi:glycosyltransferase [Brevibacillus invocatus]|uniref:Glycosyltransferase n=1 Tax=Brevibacillus invocatus TaxID=173959 RepID=A0A3M8CH19_9BACL|nr:WecB/TagA/CpsF family glycosyltransferase [Brevibacillus invocatus]RNB74823.1 glycosyltransferase [Brevibacillus invocatus]
MINQGKHSVLGVQISAVDYEYAVEEIIAHAQEGRAFGVSALAVHGVMTGALDEIQRRRLNGLDLLVPDGQPVRWGLRILHQIRLPDRVYGPELTLRVMQATAARKIPVYLYGSTSETIRTLSFKLSQRFPELCIAGASPSRFRRLSPAEKQEVIREIQESGAKIVFVGLGCPRQETWVYEYRNQLQMPLLAVGAAFDFHAGHLPQAPAWMQRSGLEWLFRLIQEPKRLWRRYLYLNPLYLLSLFAQAIGVRNIPVLFPDQQVREESFG